MQSTFAICSTFTFWDNANLQKFPRFFTFSIKRICNISFSSNLWTGIEVVPIEKDTLVHLLLKFRKGKQKNFSRSRKTRKSWWKCSFKSIKSKSYKTVWQHASLVRTCLLLIDLGDLWGQGGTHKPTDYFYFSPGKRSEVRGKFEVYDGCMLLSTMLARVGVFCNSMLIKWFRCSMNAVWLDNTVSQWLGTILLILNNYWCRMSTYRCSWDLYRRLGLNALKCRICP